MVRGLLWRTVSRNCGINSLARRLVLNDILGWVGIDPVVKWLVINGDVMDVLNEDTTKTLTVSFFEDEAQTTPATPVADVEYGVWDMTHGRLLAAGTVSPDTSVDITITSAMTCIIDAANKTEDRQLVYRAAISSGVYHIGYYQYKVRNLSGPLRYRWFKGDSYLHADSRAVRCTAGDGVPDLDNTVHMRIEDPNGTVDTITVNGTIVDAAGSDKEFRFDLTSTQTNTLAAGDYSVTVYAVQSGGGGDTIVIKKGKATVVDLAE